MDIDRPYVAENAAERTRLGGLVARLSEEDLARPLYDGWTVAVALAHLAFWDRYTLALLQRWQRDGVELASTDVDAVNDALLALGHALSPRAAAQLAVDAAEAVDRTVAGLDPALVAAIQGTGRTRALQRSLHRRDHLDDIEQALHTGGDDERN